MLCRFVGVDPADGEEKHPKTPDVYNFEEDSSDTLSPEQPASQDSQSSSASPRDPRGTEAPSTSPPTSCALQVGPPSAHA